MDSYSDYDYEDDAMEPEPPQKRTIPTVFRWENGGRDVLLAGSFNEWKARIPMNLRLVLTILWSCIWISVLPKIVEKGSYTGSIIYH